MELLLTCLAMCPAATLGSLNKPRQVNVAEVAQQKKSEKLLQQGDTLLQQRRDGQQGPIEWLNSIISNYASEDGDSSNASAPVAMNGGSAGKHSAGSSVKGRVIAIPLESQLLQRSPAFRGPRNSSNIELADRKRKDHYQKNEVPGAVVQVKLQSQLMQRKSIAPLREEERPDSNTFLAAHGTVEHDAVSANSMVDSTLQKQEKRMDTYYWRRISFATCNVCMWLTFGLLFSCCSFGGAAHSTSGQLIGGFFNFVLPLGVIIYVCFMSNLFSEYWDGKPICGWCHAICIWAFIQITCGMCYLGCSVLGVGVAATMGHKTMEEKKVLKG
jgi:hypothetical protein